MFEKFWSAGKKCYIYYDERTIGSCDLFTNNRPGNVWFDGSYEGQTCEERISWWSSQVWHRCLKNSGLPYPGTKEVKLRDDAFYMTKWSSEEPTQLPSSAPTQNVDVRLYKQNWACQVLQHVRGPTTPEACADAVLADSTCSKDHFTWSDSSLVGVPCKCVRDCGSTGVYSNVYDTYSITLEDTHSRRRAQNLIDVVSIVLQAQGLNNENTRAICRSVADSVHGTVEYCSLRPRLSRRNLADTSSLFMELAVSDTDSTLNQIQSENFIPTLENLPKEVSISDIDLFENAEKKPNLESENS